MELTQLDIRFKELREKQIKEERKAKDLKSILNNVDRDLANFDEHINKFLRSLIVYYKFENLSEEEITLRTKEEMYRLVDTKLESFAKEEVREMCNRSLKNLLALNNDFQEGDSLYYDEESGELKHISAPCEDSLY